jgi:hypothetical protein
VVQHLAHDPIRFAGFTLSAAVQSQTTADAMDA